MKLHNMSPAEGSKTAAKRLGRGIGSGLGKTSGKGHKGQWARSGGGVRIGFEGGQMPLIRRIPKRGFTNNWSKMYSIVNISSLEMFENDAVVDTIALLEARILSKVEKDGVKILANGTFTKKLTVIATKFTPAAQAAIEKNGGKVEVL